MSHYIAMFVRKDGTEDTSFSVDYIRLHVWRAVFKGSTWHLCIDKTGAAQSDYYARGSESAATSYEAASRRAE